MSNNRTSLKKINIFIVIFLSLLTIPIFFQNCSSAPDDSRDVSSVASTAPFAFETQMDHIAYMSCSNMPSGYDTNAYFTFKMGAIGNSSGVKLNSAFVNATRNLNASGKAQALAQSPANGDVFIALAIRQASNLQSIFQSGSLFAADFIGSLTTSDIANSLAANNGATFINSFSSGKLEDNIQFTQSETAANQIRTELAVNGSYLAQTYNKAGDDPANALGATANSISSIYGRGYKMNFALGFGQSNAFSSGPIRIMQNVREYDLSNGQQTSSVWDCKSTWNFMIVRQQDLGVSAFCENYTVEPTPTSEQKEMYDALRALLPKSDWGVNLSRRCIVPLKSGACYGNVTPTINYNGGTCNMTTGNCPHYVSICKKR